MKKTIGDKDVSRFVAGGMAAFLPGMVYMAELISETMQDVIDSLKRDLGMFQEMDERPAKKKKDRRGSSWAGLSAEERSAEMKRRRAIGEAKKASAAKLHPRDAAHPGHEAWLEKMRAAQKKRWDSFTPAERKAQIRKMSKAGRASSHAASARRAVEELRATA